MKTAMQELRNDILIMMQLDIIGQHCGNRVLNYIDTLYLEKEKEQIKTAFDIGIEEDKNLNVFIIDGEDYYNKSYN